MFSPGRIRTLARWSLRARLRDIRRALATPRGLGSVVAVALALLVAWGPLVRLGASPVAGESTPGAALGALALGQLGLLAAGVFAAPSFVEAAFRSRPGASRAFPFAMPEALTMRLTVRVLAPVPVYLTLFHLLFFAATARLAFGGAAGVTAYALGTVAWCVVAVVASAALWARWVGRGSSRSRLALTRGLAPFLFLALFAVPVMTLSGLHRARPGALPALGAALEGWGALWPPLLAGGLAGRSPVVGLVAGVGLVVSAIALVVPGLAAWGARTPLFVREERLAGSSHTGRRPLRAFPFTTSLGRRWALVRAFLAKDLVLPALRDPLRHLGESGVIVASGVTWLVVLAVGGSRDVPPALLETGTLVAAALFPLWAGFRWGLPSLGLEGRALAILRPLVSPGRMLGAKVLSAIGFTAVQALPVAALLALAGRVAGLPVAPTADVLASAFLASILFPTLGVAVGFLLPGRSRGAASSRVAQGIYAAVASVLLLLTGLMDAGVRLGVVGGAAGMVERLTPTVLGLAMAGGMAALGVRSMRVRSP